MQIHVNFDQATQSLPPGFVSAVNYVVSVFDGLFLNNITITINVGFGEINGQSLDSGALGESIPVLSGQAGYVAIEDYSSVRNVLIAEGAPGSSTLPVGAPAGVPSILALTQAEGKALGLITNSGNLDGFVGFSSAPNIFGYGINTAPALGQYYFVGVVEHEFSEIMGRISLLGGSLYSPMDLFRYAAINIRQFSTVGPSYFSLNGGVTNLDSWNNFQTVISGDLGDWAPSAGNDAFDDYSSPGVLNPLTSTDVALMNALGWKTAVFFSMALSASSDSGVPNGWVTNNTSPIISGQGQVGDVVALFVNGNQVGSATVGVSGTWSVAAGSLALGSYAVEAVETASGQTVATSASTLIIANTRGNVGDFFAIGTGGATTFFLTGTGQLAAWEYGSVGQALGAAGFNNAGQAFRIDAQTSVVGAGEDFFGLGLGERAVFLRGANGHLQVWEFNAGNQATGAVGLTNCGLAFDIDSTTTVVGGGQDFFGLGIGEHTAFLRTGTGELQAWEFNSFGQATAATDFINAGSVFGIDPNVSIVGAVEDALLPGDRDLFAREGTQLFLWQFNSAEQMTAYVGLTKDGAPFALDSATNVIGTTINLSNGRESIGLESNTGQITWWDLSGTALTNPHS